MASRLRFNIVDDICLLREVLAANPYEDSSKWALIQENVQKETEKNYSVRTLKEHVQHLLQLWKKGDRANRPIRKSGTEEQYGEKEQLLQQIADMARDFTAVKHTSRNNSKSNGIAARDRALPLLNLESVDILEPSCSSMTNEPMSPEAQTLDVDVSLQEDTVELSGENSTETLIRMSSNRKRKAGQLSRECLEIIKHKQKQETEFRKNQQQIEREKLEIKRRKIKLEEEKYEVEKEERLHRIEMENKQQALMEKIINLVGNK